MPTDEQMKWVQSALGVTTPSDTHRNADAASSGAAANTKKSPEVNTLAEKEDSVQRPASDQPAAVEFKTDATIPFAISASVGRHGKNKPADVKAVQAALNHRVGAGLDTDGDCQSKTIAAIKAFQKKLGMPYPDGVIEPGNLTERALNGEQVEVPKANKPAKGHSGGGGGKVKSSESLGDVSESTKGAADQTSKGKEKPATGDSAGGNALRTAKCTDPLLEEIASAKGAAKDLLQRFLIVMQLYFDAISEEKKAAKENVTAPPKDPAAEEEELLNRRDALVASRNAASSYKKAQDSVTKVEEALKDLASQKTAQAAETLNRAVETASPQIKDMENWASSVLAD